MWQSSLEPCLTTFCFFLNNNESKNSIIITVTNKNIVFFYDKNVGSFKWGFKSESELNFVKNLLFFREKFCNSCYYKLIKNTETYQISIFSEIALKMYEL